MRNRERREEDCVDGTHFFSWIIISSISRKGCIVKLFKFRNSEIRKSFFFYNSI